MLCATVAGRIWSSKRLDDVPSGTILEVIVDGSTSCYVDVAAHSRRPDQNASSLKTDALVIDAAAEMLMQIRHTKL